MTTASLRGQGQRQASVGSVSGAFLSPNMAQAGLHQPSSTSGQATSAAARSALHFRHLIWDATIPIAISIDSAELPEGVRLDRAVETYYVCAPRISYLPLLLDKLQTELLSLMISDEEALQQIKPESCWFTYEGVPLRWHWPIGLLYDYYTANTAPTKHRASVGGSSLSVGMQRLSLMGDGSVPDRASSSPANTDSSTAFGPVPWPLSLKIGKAPAADKMHSAPGLEHCRTSFMSMIKEADFVRHGSTKRVTNLRKAEQDALWEGVVQHDFDMYWSVASKLTPSMAPSAPQTPTSTMPGALSPSRTPSIASNGDGFSVDRSAPHSSLMQQFNESQSSLHSAAPSESGFSIAESTSTAGHAGKGAGSSTSAYRSLPMRFHLPQGAPIVQEPVAPYNDDGRPVTLHAVLSALFPLLFPATSTFSASLTSTAPTPLAYPVVQGIRMPLDAEIPWIGSMLASADGWVSVCVHLLVEGEL